MGFKTSKEKNEFIKQAADRPEKTEKKTTVLIYLTEEQKAFIERVKFEKRKSKMTMSDLISEAIEQYLKKKY